MAQIVIRGSIKINSTPGDASGDPLLARDASTGEVGINSSALTATLPSGQLLVGNASNVAVARTIGGDISIDNLGVAAISTGVIVNADINPSAAIAVNKLAALTVSRAIVSDGSGVLTPATTTAAQIGYLSTTTSDVQVQIDGKQATIIGAASTVVTSNLTASRVAISNTSGKIDTSAVTTTELGYLTGVTSAIQTQFGTKLTYTAGTPAATGDTIYYNGSVYTNLPIGTNGQVLTVSGGTPTWASGTSNGLPSGGATDQYLRKNSNTDYDTVWDTLNLSKISDVTSTAADVNLLLNLSATVTSVELAYLAGLTGVIQTQLNNKQSSSLTYNSILVGNASNIATQLSVGTNGQVLGVVGGSVTWTTPPAPGNVSGIAPSVDNAIARWNGTLADSIQNSGVIIDDTDNITGIASLRTVNQGSMILRELTASGTNAVSIRASGTMGADYTITLPAAAPASNTYLKYDGTNYVWDAASGSGGYSVIENAGVTLTSRTTLNLLTGLTAADDGAETTLALGGPVTQDVSFTPSSANTRAFTFGATNRLATHTVNSQIITFNGGTSSNNTIAINATSIDMSIGGAIYGSISGTYKYNFGQNNTIGSVQNVFATGSDNVINASWVTAGGEAATHNVNSNNSASFGWTHIIGDGVSSASGANAFSVGVDTINRGNGSMVSGHRARVLYVATTTGGFVHGLGTGYPSSIPYVTASAGAVNISRNTITQTDGNGALAPDSAIFMTVDGHIPASSPRSVIIGGQNYTFPINTPDYVAMPGVVLFNTPDTDNNIITALVYDSSSKKIKKKDIAAVNGTNVLAGNIELGGALTKDTTLSGNFYLNLNNRSVGIGSTDIQTVNGVSFASFLRAGVAGLGDTSFLISATTVPQLLFNSTGQSVDNRLWQFGTNFFSTGYFCVATLTDGASSTILTALSRAGNFAIGNGTGTILSRLHVVQSTLGSSVLRLQSTATNDDPVVDTYQNRVTTTDGTLTTIHTLATTSDTNITLTGLVLGRRTGGVSGTTGDIASYKIEAVYKNVAGTVTLVGGGTSAIGESQGAWDCSLAISGTNILIQVLGAGNNNVTWHMSKLEVSTLGS